MPFNRVTNNSLSHSVIDSLMRNKSTLALLQEQISSGTKVSKPSDDALAAIGILSINTNIGKSENYLANIDTVEPELTVSENSVKSTIDYITRAKELIVSAANGVNGVDQISAINNEIKQILEGVTGVANTQYNGKYIFAGTNTGTVPFDLDEANNNQIIYNGTPETENYERKAEIADNVTVAMNLPGDSVFGTYEQISAGPPAVMGGKDGIIKTLSELKKMMNDMVTAGSVDHDSLRGKLGNLDKDLNTVLEAQTKIGGIASRVTMTKNKLEDDQISLASYKSKLGDIDLAKSISDLNFQQNSLEASLKVGAQVIQRSLLDYI